MGSGRQPLTVVKLGGALLDDAALLADLWRQVGEMTATGQPVVVVHGGGRQATELAARLGHTPRILHGRRVTTDLDLDIARWAFRGALNTSLVAAAHREGVRAAGLSGVDGGTLRVHRRPPREVDGETVDFGWVGDVDGADATLLHVLLAAGVVPVVAPLGVDAEGLVYNVNADTVAVALAEALGADRLVFVAEAGGLRRDPRDPASRIAACDAEPRRPRGGGGLDHRRDARQAGHGPGGSRLRPRRLHRPPPRPLPPRGRDASGLGPAPHSLAAALRQ
jgi:acetylglutamate kinase